MEYKDIEWAAFLFNAMGEDGAYIKYLIEIEERIKKNKDQPIGDAIIGFLNSWRSRIPKETGNKIDAWYREKRDQLLKLPDSLIIADFENKNIADNIKSIYESLVGEQIGHIGDTAASKILHILKPNLFVPWDKAIKAFYESQKNKNSHKRDGSADIYLFFLKEMQRRAKALIQENGNFLNDLNSKVKELYEGNLQQVKNNQSMLLEKNGNSKKNLVNDYDMMIAFMQNVGKTLAKYIDEYNWITITKSVKIIPKWHPD